MGELVEVLSFDNESMGWKVRVTIINGEPWFVATEVCNALEIANSRDAVSRLDDDEKLMLKGKESLVGLTDDPNITQLTVISEPGLYKLIMSSRKPEAKPFQRWVTHDILPAIRKVGSYSLQSQQEGWYKAPSLKEALLMVIDQMDTIEKLESDKVVLQQCLAEAQPKINYVTRILESKGNLLITQIAKDYGLSGRKLNAILHDEKVQYKKNDQWLLYSQYQDMGYTKSKTTEYRRSNGELSTKLHTEWTEKGRLFIHDILSKRGIVPQMVRVTSKTETDDKLIIFPSKN